MFFAIFLNLYSSSSYNKGCGIFAILQYLKKTINKSGSLKVEEYPIKTHSWSLNSNELTTGFKFHLNFL